ncbi:hypothetical protein DV515_00016913 [Chloebia gouldiae]|uniref:ELMO domain-containing protein n=1 Tax=Chloebia gouldiae TaxID=44316 RepID=A0A3L8RA34_CHLGU|nr:hypothetical protein DV515_00016913 [Chloebia gouldiae]
MAALGQGGVLQELVLGAGQPPEPGELSLLPLDQSWLFLLDKAPASPQGSSTGGMSQQIRPVPDRSPDSPEINLVVPGVAPVGISLGKEGTQGWGKGGDPTPCLPPGSDCRTPSLGQGSARSSARPGRSGRLWKRSSQRGAAALPERGALRQPGTAGLRAPLLAPAPPGAALPEGLFVLQGRVRAPRRRGILAALLRCLRGPPRLRPQLRAEQQLALAMAQCALDDSEWVHMRILQTIYRQLTCSRLGCPRYGAHWEELGFQGADPGTDLRGTGMLGLMQILFFNFPFCIMSVNITRIVIQALQEERLSRECNRRQQVIGVLNDLYAAAFLRLSRLWEQQHGTVADAAFFLKELELSTKKKPRQLLKSLEAYLSRGLQPPSLPSSQIHFTSICDPRVELEGDS